MATVDGSEEPLFADDLDAYSDEEPPPLPPPIVPRSSSIRDTTSSAGTSTGSRGGGVVNTAGRSRLESPPANRTHDQDIGRISNRRRGRREQDEGEGQGDNQGEGDGNDPPTKKVRKPILTLKTQHLFSNEGFPYLVKEFPKLKFSGKGKEASDLKLLLNQYEEWANNLFPKLTFHDLCCRVEALAKKNDFRAQVNCIRRSSVGLDNDEPLGAASGNGVANERLSPELDDSDLFPNHSDHDSEDSDDQNISQRTVGNNSQNVNTSQVPGSSTDSSQVPAGSSTDSSQVPAGSSGNAASQVPGSSSNTASQVPTVSSINAPGSSSSNMDDQIIPDPWDIVPEDEERDVDPYEDFPEL